MPHLNVEIKARCANPELIHQKLKAYEARYIGLDHQVDTYFRVANGRLKLRQGSIEQNLIHYHRSDQAGPKASDVQLYKPGPESEHLKEALRRALGVLVVVDKQRHIYFVENVKFHVDVVQGLGSFVEIEAIDKNGDLGQAHLQQQCDYYIQHLGIVPEDLISVSYSDLIMAQDSA
ncbi:MAG: class IV adenylate cyclase [Bacteroidota bacterium]